MFRSIAQKTRPLNRLFSNRAYAVKRDDLFWMDDIVRCKKEIKETEEKISKICKQIKEREYFSIANHDKFALLYGKSGIMERLRNSSYSLPLDTPYWAYPAIYQDSKRLLELLNTKDPRFFADKENSLYAFATQTVLYLERWSKVKGIELQSRSKW